MIVSICDVDADEEDELLAIVQREYVPTGGNLASGKLSLNCNVYRAFRVVFVTRVYYSRTQLFEHTNNM